MNPGSAPAAILAGTANRHKLAEIAELVSDLPVEVLGADALGVPVAVAENGATFEENARLKAFAYARAAARSPGGRRPRWVISDDSGLSVEALGGAPGVRSARYAGPGASDADNNRKLLAALADVPPHRRRAVFVSALACAEVSDGPRREPRLLFEVRGECCGLVIDQPRGARGFGYDPLFFVPEIGKTYAEMDGSEKNRLSHRGRAFRLLIHHIRPLVVPSIASAIE